MIAVEPSLKDKTLSLIRAMLNDNVISQQDLQQFVTKENDPLDPEQIRLDMEEWYRTLGIETLLGHEFQLKRPFFTRWEITEAYQNEEMAVCVPAGVDRKCLSKLFNLDSWSIDDELIPKVTETEDFWFFTKTALKAEETNKTGTEVKRNLESKGLLGMTLERYIAFVARMRYLYGKTPDEKNWVWLTREKYEGKSMLIAGFDSNLKLSVHAWLPQFHSPYCGVRYARIVDHLYLAEGNK
jgi:hypothetical protein